MTIEVLKAARVLAEKIAVTEKRIEEWNTFNGFKDEKVEGPEMYYTPAPDSETALQQYNLRYWERELERLQREFDAL